jgi:hypothetical protein
MTTAFFEEHLLLPAAGRPHLASFTQLASADSNRGKPKHQSEQLLQVLVNGKSMEPQPRWLSKTWARDQGEAIWECTTSKLLRKDDIESSQPRHPTAHQWL